MSCTGRWRLWFHRKMGHNVCYECGTTLALVQWGTDLWICQPCWDVYGYGAYCVAPTVGGEALAEPPRNHT